MCQSLINRKYLPPAKVMPIRTPNAEMARTSSTLEAAITKVGIPFSCPQPSSDRRNMHGTITAGVTADKINLQLIINCYSRI